MSADVIACARHTTYQASKQRPAMDVRAYYGVAMTNNKAAGRP